MNSITIKQNEEKYLRMQYSARVCYNFAAIANYLVWILCVIGYIINNFMTIKSFVGQILPLVSAIFAVAIFVIGEYLIQKAIILGAAFRKCIDYNLFDLNANEYYGYNESKLFEKSFWICDIRKKDSKIRMSNTGTDAIRGVKEWYTDIETFLDGNKLIFKCQKQNLFFDQKISATHRNFFYAILAVIIVVLIIIYRNQTIINMIIALLPTIPLIIKVFKEIVTFRKYNKLVDKVNILKDDIEDDIENVNRSEIIRIQDCIDERRKMNFVPINKIHNSKSMKLHENFSKITND